MLKPLAKSPVTTYRSIVRFRDSFLAKVQYLESESAKWKTAFKIAKMPYTLLLSLGFSPQMAVTLLFAGSTVGGGVIVNETILAEKVSLTEMQECTLLHQMCLLNTQTRTIR